MCSAKRLRGEPASITRVRRRERPRAWAAARPLAPPPMMTLSQSSPAAVLGRVLSKERSSLGESL
ncbi:hypothetical protein GCM10009618_16810 [Nesterenkonia lacusekhoensis]